MRSGATRRQCRELEGADRFFLELARNFLRDSGRESIQILNFGHQIAVHEQSRELIPQQVSGDYEHRKDQDHRDHTDEDVGHDQAIAQSP